MPNRHTTSPWQIPPTIDLPEDFVEQVRAHLPQASQCFAAMVAQLLARRGVQMAQIGPFLDPAQYRPASPFALGGGVTQACDRLHRARDRHERIAVWGDFDADGITATAVLWEGLKAVFPPEQLTYVIPNRLTQSHGLNHEGVDALSEQGYSLIITGDTGSTDLEMIRYAKAQGIDIIVTDHHTLPEALPDDIPVALINPRTLPPEHPLAHLSGVAVAYKVIEALYQHLKCPDTPEALLDLVAIGLIADLVELRGDCRYLAQRGLLQLQKRQRPGLKHLIQQCRRSGDRPADISYGLGPRINAVSRIYGDASFCVELLTTADDKRAAYLAQQAELANQRRRPLQQRVLQEVEAQLTGLNDTTGILVLASPHWPVGILGLVAGQVAQRYDRPALLLQTPATGGVARGSARSVRGLDLYSLIRQHTHLLHQFGGHPYALGLTLPVENIPLLRAALDRQVRVTPVASSPLIADGLLTVQEVGHDLFQAFKSLEPFGMGHPIPRLRIQAVWFSHIRGARQSDLRGKRTNYAYITCRICDRSAPEGRPAIWWGHHQSELPLGPCDIVVELDFDSRCKDYRLRIITVHPTEDGTTHESEEAPLPAPAAPAENLDPDAAEPPAYEAEQVWQQLMGLAKYLCRTGDLVDPEGLAAHLGIGVSLLELGLETLETIGIMVDRHHNQLQMRPTHEKAPPSRQQAALYQFLISIQEAQFQRRYGHGASPLEDAAHGQTLNDVVEVP